MLMEKVEAMSLMSVRNVNIRDGDITCVLETCVKILRESKCGAGEIFKEGTPK